MERNMHVYIMLFLAILQLNLHATISGIKMEIVEANQYGTVHIPLVSKQLDIKSDMFRLGYMQAGKKTISLLKDEHYYVITLKDNYSKSPLHVIANGAYMKRRPYNAGVLTEISFRLCQEFLGNHYDKQALKERLDKIAKKVISQKGFVLDNKLDIDYTDILLYKNGSHVLRKLYDPDVMDLEKKIKVGAFRHQDAYDFVYVKSLRKHKRKEKDGVKIVKPLYRLIVFKHIPKNTALGTTITTLKPLRVGSAKVDEFEILGDTVPFRIDRQGKLILAAQLLQPRYSFDAIAHTKDANSNKIEFNIIIDQINKQDRYKLK